MENADTKVIKIAEHPTDAWSEKSVFIQKNQYVICFVMQICLHQFDFQIVGIIRVSFLL